MDWQGFARARGGAIAMLFALLTIPLVLLIGLAVDFRSVQISRADLQNALDSAVLAAARTYAAYPSLSDSAREARATQEGEALFTANLGRGGPDLESMRIDFTYVSDTNQVSAVARADAPTSFGALVGIDMIELAVDGRAQGADPRRVEVVLALDNTGSMYSNNRFILMRQAAMDFVEKLYAEQTPPEPGQPGKLYVGVVPWTTTVNINMERPLEEWDASGSVTANATFDGSRALPPTPHKSFETQNTMFPQNHHILTSPPTTNVVDIALWPTLGGTAYNSTVASQKRAWDALFSPATWRGCIRAAPGERTVSSSNAVTRLTDAPVANMRWPAAAVEPILKKFTSGAANGFVRCGSGNNSQNDNTYNSYFDASGRTCRTASNSNTNTTTIAYSASSYQAVCLSDPYEFAYLATHSMCRFKSFTLPRTNSGTPGLAGPNVNCPTSMLGLSGNKVQVLNNLNRMFASSDGTQQDLGVMWGLRMLSPNTTWKNFFGHTGNNAPYAYSTDEVRKVIVLLTDGENNAPNEWEGYYGCETTNATTRGGSGNAAGACWAYSGLSGGLNNAKMDALTRDACKAAREDYDIEMYTIAIDVTNSTAIKLLKDCVGADHEDERAYNISAAEIGVTFLAIADQTLRLTN